jgi:hypothetical protein
MPKALQANLKWLETVAASWSWGTFRTFSETLTCILKEHFYTSDPRIYLGFILLPKEASNFWMCYVPIIHPAVTGQSYLSQFLTKKNYCNVDNSQSCHPQALEKGKRDLWEEHFGSMYHVFLLAIQHHFERLMNSLLSFHQAPL